MSMLIKNKKRPFARFFSLLAATHCQTYQTAVLQFLLL
ncbi:hypothetical protein CGSHiHH_00603 [Haemophilus influenzae PittHH]|nr:hypothetical protein CGSHiHH_00603 [Haemophilus influenzae PittHH]